MLSKRQTQAMAKEIKVGSPVMKTLEKHGVSQAAWYAACKEYGITYPRGGRSECYATARLREVMRRAKQGEFIRDICLDMGMDYSSFRRACRKAGIPPLSGRALCRNQQQRDTSRTGRSKGAESQAPIIARTLIKGISTREAAERHGVSHGYARHLAKRLRDGWKPPKTADLPITRLAQQILELLKDTSLTYSVIGRQLGCSQTFVSAVSKRRKELKRRLRVAGVRD